jgi:hypothetical protein
MKINSFDENKLYDPDSYISNTIFTVELNLLLRDAQPQTQGGVLIERLLHEQIDNIK